MSRRIRFGSTTDGTLDSLDGQIDTGNENGNNPDNDLVIRDSTGTIVARYNESATTWELEQPLDLQSNNVTNVGALDTEVGVIDNIVLHKESPAVSEHTGVDVDIDETGFFEIFDVSEPVNVLGGTVVGDSIGSIRVTFDDESNTEYSRTGRGNDGNGDRYSVSTLLPADEVTGLEAESTTQDQVVGWEVVTI